MNNDINNKVKKLIVELKGPLQEIQLFQNQRLEILKSRIKYVILNKVTEKREVEKIFDELLDIVYWDTEITKPYFYQLISYYKNIDNELTKDYEKYYIDIVEGGGNNEEN